MEDGIVKYIAIGVAVALIVGAAIFGINYMKQGKSVGTAGGKQMANIQAELSDAEFDAYDGVTVTGSEVINVVKKFEDDDVAVKVITKKTTAFYGYSLDASNELQTTNVSSASKMQELSSPLYVNPSGSFVGSILKDTNDVITGICFTQQ